MIRSFSLSVFLLVCVTFSFAQVHEIPLSRGGGGQKSISKSKSGIRFSFSQDKILSKTRTAKDGVSFSEIWLKNSYPNGEVGIPNIPAYKELIRIPKGSRVSVNVVSHTEELISLKEKGISQQLYPNQLSVSKNQDTANIKFEINKSAYAKNSYSNSPIATIEVLGTLRSATIARLVVNPIDYNPGAGSIKVYNDIDVDVSFENTLSAKEEQDFDSKTYSPYFDILYNSLEQPAKSSYTDHPDLTKYPVKMLIVSNRMFEQTLEPFIQWKNIKGFNVKTVYTDDIGTSSAQIKSFIQQEYNSATPENPAPSFLVIVGDVDQVPSSATGSETDKETDLYYACADDDMFPDMYYGRLSATSTVQLENIINKILYYEKYQFEDPSYLNKVTLIAGIDDTWNPRVGQPTIKYGTANYFNQSKGFATVNEYGVASDPNNPNAKSSYIGCYDPERIAVGLVNYTAHCGIAEWAGPSLTNSSITGFSNTNKYPLSIGNCCLSGDFGSSECIGEAWIRAKNKGAVTYIGSSPNTFWLEDFYWSVGAFPLVGNNNGYVPTFQETTTGMYDAPFVSSYVTTGGMVFAGNLAVTEVNIQGFPTSQSSSLYYWQAYNVLGDPSLIPYFTEAETNQVNYTSSVILGESVFNVKALPNSYIAISKDNQIIGTAFVDATGEVSVPIIPIASTGDVTIVITRPQTIPIIDNITAIQPSGPHLMLGSFSIDDQLSNNNGRVDYNETFKVNLTVKNIGINDATNVRVKITGTDDYITIQSNDSVNISNIPHNDGYNIINEASVFTFKTLTTIPDQHIATFTLNFYSDQGNWSSRLRMVLNSPALELGDLSIDDKLGGNNDKILNPGESCIALVQIKNIGHALAKDVSFQITIPESIKNDVTINKIQDGAFSLEENSTSTFPFRVVVNPDLRHSLTIPITLQMNVVEPNNLSTTYEKSIKVIPNNSIIISNNTVKTCLTYFYDSGGKNGNYDNNENYTYTIAAENESKWLKLTFTEFAIENNYDFLYIYDGSDVNCPQITGSPFTGGSIPSEIISSGNSFTFKFTSDDTNGNKGWESIFECVDPQIPNCVNTPYPSNGATLVHDKMLSWTPQPYSSNYEVFLGSTPTNLAFAGKVSQSLFTFNPEKSKAYYWKVIPTNYLGSNNTCSSVWSFTTDTICGEARMSTNTISVDTLLFYDSGGASQTYKNDEDYTLTFKPKYSGNSLVVDFLSFNIENIYDKLYIYNGLTANSPLINTYSGPTLPEKTQSTNPDGALTFVFHSDNSTVYDGWKAIIKSIGTTSVFKTITLKVQNNSTPIVNASICIDGIIKTTNSSGLATFSVLTGDKNITINALGFKQKKQIVSEAETNATIVINLEKPSIINAHIVDIQTLNYLSGVKVRALSDSSFTNSLGNTSILLNPGTYTFTSYLKGYLPYNQSLVVTENNIVNLEISLTASKNKVKFIVSDALGNKIEGATISIGTTILQTNSEGVASDFIYTGNYTLSTSKSQFFTQVSNIFINDTATKKIILDSILSLQNIEFTLLGKGPKGNSLLNFNSVDFYYKNKFYSKFITDAEGKGNIKLPIGNLSYSSSREGYYSISNKTLLIDGIKSNFQDTLYQKTYSVQFNVNSQQGAIQDALITLKGYTPDFTDKQGQVIFPNIGYEKKLQYTLQCNGFADVTGTIDVINPTIINISIISKNHSKLYPNPTTNILNIESGKRISRVSLINTLGTIVLSKEGNQSNQESISMGSLTPGVYILIINSENSIPEKRLIIKK